METKFLFNYAPPALLNMPAAAFSVLKSYLEAHGIGCKIYYWNFRLAKLQMDFLWQTDGRVLGDEANNLLLFFNYISIRMSDKSTYNKIKCHLIGMKPQFVGREDTLFDNHMKRYADLLEKEIDECIDEIYNPDIKYYGFSANLYQWLVSVIIAARLKNKHPECVIILGGMGTKNAAIKYLKMFAQFDFALWGEGENSLLSLVEHLEHGNCDLESVSNLVYRENDKVVVSENRKVVFANLNLPETHPDYSDFFVQRKDFSKIIELEKCIITIEASRGCHWNRCHFCYLNTGYKNRSKNVEVLINEIKSNIDNFHSYTFSFLDNDIINNDYERFNNFLDQLFLLKREHPEFKIEMAEIITKGICASCIKKMSLAGFECVQIGYESASNNLLRKIDKKNTFASNALFIKFAVQYKISTSGLNIITGLLEETEEDIMEAISSLYYLRFYLNYASCRHTMTRLTISNTSRYYKKIDFSSNWLRRDMFDRFLPISFLKFDEELDIIDAFNLKSNPLWNNFIQVEDFYLRNSYSYELITYGNSILFKEYFNNTSINEIEFGQDSLEWFVLNKTNENVKSYNELKIDILNEVKDEFMDVEIINLIEDLKSEGIIYASEDYSEIVSLINTTLLT